MKLPQSSQEICFTGSDHNPLYLILWSWIHLVDLGQHQALKCLRRVLERKGKLTACDGAVCFPRHIHTHMQARAYRDRSGESLQKVFAAPGCNWLLAQSLPDMELLLMRIFRDNGPPLLLPKGPCYHGMEPWRLQGGWSQGPKGLRPEILTTSVDKFID